jgi:hypothetical protein
VEFAKKDLEAEESGKQTAAGRRLSREDLLLIFEDYDKRAEEHDDKTRTWLDQVAQCVPPFESSEFYAGMLQGAVLVQAAVMRYSPFVIAEYMAYVMALNMAISNEVRDAMKSEGKL